MLDYLVLYHSLSGNTERVAAEIFSALPGKSKDLINIDTASVIPNAALYIVGFGVYQGTCHLNISDFLSGLSGKGVAIFATCAMGDSEDYGNIIKQTVSAWIEDDNDYLGGFICQGKLPQAFRNKYENAKCNKDNVLIRSLLNSFDSALTHPDALDIEHAKVFALNCVSKYQERTKEATDDKG
ncbi:MAG: flavodoxin family protein [Suipraeoptans sp.]